MAQSKVRSLKEALVNIAVGIVIAFISQVIVFRANGIDVSYLKHAELVGWFTLISLVRQYAIRRWFNKGEK